jgi:hypothetical protein
MRLSMSLLSTSIGLNIPIEFAQWVFWCAFGLYCMNIVVGIIAHLRWFHFGKAHHVLYFIVFVSSGAAAFVAFHPGLVLPVVALALLPKSRPWTWRHPTCAFAGLVGFGWAIAAM